MGKDAAFREQPLHHRPLNTIATHPAFSNLAALVNHGDLPTIYPPAAQFVFAAGAAVGVFSA
ncbi:MAG: hypothetical protein R2861_02070 [Desulfobacterales bacterium]